MRALPFLCFSWTCSALSQNHCTDYLLSNAKEREKPISYAHAISRSMIWRRGTKFD